MEKPTQLLARYIAAYAPYGLKLIDLRDNHEFELMGLYDDSFSIYSQSEPTRTIYFNNNDYPDIKPILRPLSDLIKPTEPNSGITWQGLINREYSYEWFYDDLSFSVTGNDYYNLKDAIAVYEKLLEWHFDVFGLIDAGLAIDINTIQPC